jgi:hypothetical protein
VWTVDPNGILLRVAAMSVLTGALCAGLAALAIYLGSTRLPPRVPPNRVWQEWRSKRMVWSLSLVLAALGAALTADGLTHHLAEHDLYWLNRPGDLLRIAWAGVGTGYLLLLLGCVAIGLMKQRRTKGSR